MTETTSTAVAESRPTSLVAITDDQLEFTFAPAADVGEEKGVARPVHQKPVHDAAVILARLCVKRPSRYVSARNLYWGV